MAQIIQPLAPQVSFHVRYADLTFGNRLGSGGFGDVFKGTWQGIAVAIKKLKIFDIASSGIEEFNKEVTLMSDLRHPHIVSFYKACTEPGNYCIVMELCEKGSLYDWLRTSQAEGAEGWTYRKRIAIEVAQGLWYLHSCEPPVIHRDLKSLNVLLDKELRAKISDFGLSKLRVESSLTSAGQASIVGTLRWNPPELLSGDVRHHSTKTDMYSYGMVLWEIATRTIPFAGVNEQIAYMWIVQGKKEPFPKEVPNYMQELIELCRCEISKRPTAEQVVKELQKEETLIPTSAPPSPLVVAPPQPTAPLSLVTLAPPLARTQPPTDLPFPSEISKRPTAEQVVKELQKEETLIPTSAPPPSPLVVAPPQLTAPLPLLTLAPSLARTLPSSISKTSAEEEYQAGLRLRNSGNVIEAFNYYRKAAELGHSEAQYLLYSTVKDLKQAEEWCQKAAKQGHFAAQGACYYFGWGVHKDYQEAVKWYQKAADQGHADAQNNLGICYKTGEGIAQDNKMAVKWYRKAADQGHADAQTRLGHCYRQGQGIAQDCQEAVKWYQKAADQGYANAQYALGECYMGGEGVARNASIATSWYQKAAKQGNAPAHYALGWV